MTKKSNNYITYNGKKFKVIPGYPKYYVSKDAEIYSAKTSKLLRIRSAANGETGCLSYDIVLLSENGKLKPTPVHKLVALAWCPLPKGYTTKEVLGNFISHSLLVDHVNGDKLDNHASNLRWVTSLENSRFNNYDKESRRQKLLGNQNAKIKHNPYTGEVKLYNYYFKGKKYTISELIKELGCSKSSITEAFRCNTGYVKTGELTKVAIDRRVNQYDLEGNYIATYKTPKEASDKTGVYSTGITACLNGRLQTCGKFTWKWTRDTETNK